MLDGAFRRKPEPTATATNIYDKVDEYPDCTVQVLTNTVTGEVSVGWWRNDRKPRRVRFEGKGDEK